MHIRTTTMQKDKTKWGIAAAVFATLAVTSTLAFAVHATNWSPQADLVVDDDGKATVGNCNSDTSTPHATVSSAVAAVDAGDTIKVCPGTYNEDVVLDKEVTLKGAKTNDSVKNRTFGSASESTINGLVTIQAADVKVDGFSLTNPNEGAGVIVRNAGNDATVKNNIVKTIGSNTFGSPVSGIYLERGPDGVEVTDNMISDVQSQGGSVHAVFVGDSSSTDPSENTRIDGNVILDLTSATRGAYGVLVNNGASTAAAATGYTEIKINENKIKNLNGNWVHAIGLEGETPNAVVNSNTISDLTDSNPAPSTPAVAVFFEDNPFFFTAAVNENSFKIGDDESGISLATALSAQYPSLEVDGECNWWGEGNGPSAVATGDGAMVGANVDFKPWLKSANVGKGCDDKNHHNGNSHHGGWGKHDDHWHNS